MRWLGEARGPAGGGWDASLFFDAGATDLRYGPLGIESVEGRGSA